VQRRPGARTGRERIHVVGLSGGIACGKSTVARMLRERGLPVVDADQLARELSSRGSPGLRAVVEAFGPMVLSEDGSLDRRALGRRVFADPNARARLESIMHPAIERRSQEVLAALEKSGHALAFYEAALLVEAGYGAGAGSEMLDALVVVSAPESAQLERLARRDPDLGEEGARDRIASQMPLSKKEAAADFVVVNDGTIEDLGRRVDRMLSELWERLSG